MMRVVMRALLLVVAVLAVFSSCSLMPVRPLPSGEMRLLNLQAPVVMDEEKPYNVVVTFEAEGQPQITKACFSWLNERGSVKSPSLYCYTYEVQSNHDIGSVCSRWLADGPYTRVSPVSCMSVQELQYGAPGRFVVTLQTRNVKKFYNKLECYVEYLQEGEAKQSNAVSARILVDED